MKINYLIILLITLTFNGCFEQKSVDASSPIKNDIHSLVISAIHGDTLANQTLAGLLDNKMLENNLYNLLKIDSFKLDSIKYYSVLIEYPNPICNRFALYDTAFSCYLIDKSLNGYFSSEVIMIQDSRFLKIVDEFISKDAMRVTRLSLYKKFNTKFKLVYRGFAQLKTPFYQFTQTVIFISSNEIITKLSVPKKIKIKSLEDIFKFDTLQTMYRSKQALFDTLVVNEISIFNSEIKKPFLTKNEYLSY